MAVDRIKRFFTRRGFGQALIGVATTGYLGAILYPVIRFLASGARFAGEGTEVSEVLLGDPNAIPAGSGTNFAFGSKPALIVRGKDGSFAAFLATCTHLGCTVAYDAKAGAVRCPCHGGVYDAATGKNLGGPPPKPLRRLDAVVEGGKLVVRRVKA